VPYAECDSENRIVLDTEFREKEMVKMLPGVKWSTEASTWWVPLSWSACIQLRGIFGDSLRVGPNLGAWAREQVANRISPCLALRTADDAPDLAFLSTLYPFQRAGVKFMVTARQALLADEMGLGKTVQAIAALEAIGDSAYPALIVCPNSMKIPWSEEFKKWASSRTSIVISGSAVARRKEIEKLKDGIADVGIINYEALRLHTRLEGYGSVTLSDDEKTPKELNDVPFKSVVADEAHRLKDPRAKQTRALWWVGRTAENRFALTGTPIANSPEDIWTLMRFVSPVDFPAKTRFMERYALQSFNVFGFMEVAGLKSETRDELFKILDPRMIRRTKAAVLPQLPPKTFSTRYVEMGPKQKKPYEEMRKEMMADLQGGILLAGNPLVRATRLIQFASATGEMREEQLILTDPSCKVDALEEIAEELGDQRAVVFAESRQLIEIAARRLAEAKYRVAQVTGAIAAHDRAFNVTSFNEGKLDLLLLTLGAGGEGLSFPGCSVGIFLQRSWSMVKNLQAEDRIHGIGRGVEGMATEIIDVITANTIEAKVHAIRVEKGAMLEELVRDEATLKTWLAK
jgi:SNF2 family DNA or RNA helicase